MINFLENFPQMFQQAIIIANNFALPSYYIKAKKFLLLGMGGSGVAGDIISDLLFSKGIIALSMHDYGIPGWVDKDTVVIVCSYSGDTEEPLTGFLEAREKGAKLISITTNGKLKILSEKFGIPTILFNQKCPPRAAFPYDFIFILSIFEKLGHLNFSNSEFESAIEFLEKYHLKFKSSTKTVANLAKSLALKLFDKVPVIYSSGILKGAGQRIKTQLNENAKHFAFHEILPELNHNSILGHFHPKNNIFVISVESAFDHPEVTKRQNITCELLRRDNIKYERVKFVPNQGEIAEILTMVLFGDFVSYYLSILNNEDPSNIDNIVFLKNELER
jgi:glucose/mannose-6-phosphate isomerase